MYIEGFDSDNYFHQMRAPAWTNIKDLQAPLIMQRLNTGVHSATFTSILLLLVAWTTTTLHVYYIPSVHPILAHYRRSSSDKDCQHLPEAKQTACSLQHELLYHSDTLHASSLTLSKTCL